AASVGLGERVLERCGSGRRNSPANRRCGDGLAACVGNLRYQRLGEYLAGLSRLSIAADYSKRGSPASFDLDPRIGGRIVTDQDGDPESAGRAGGCDERAMRLAVCIR